MAIGLVICAGLLGARAVWLKNDDLGPVVVVEVRGEVSYPGFHAVQPPGTLRAALTAAGGDASGVEDRVLGPGLRVLLSDGVATVEPMDQRLVFGLPLDLNTASAEALETIPGIGPSRATAIVADRSRNGSFATVDELERVHGFGALTVERIRPFLWAE